MANELVRIIIKQSGETDMTRDMKRRKVTITGHRSAVGVTADGRRVEIHDNTWALIRSWGRILPVFEHQKGRFVRDFPVRNDVVYAIIDNTPGAHGRSTEAIAWCCADRYEDGFKRIAAQRHVGLQDKLLKVVIRLIEKNAPRSPNKHRSEIMEITSIVKDATFMAALVEYYVIGRDIDDVISFHT